MKKLLSIFFLIALLSCEKDKPQLGIVEIVTSETKSHVPTFTINVKSNGDGDVLEKGVCFSESPTPTITSPKIITNETNTAKLENLIADYTYHVRAFITNSVGTSYSNEITFKTLPPGTPNINLEITRIDSTNIKYEIKINDTQGWDLSHLDYSCLRIDTKPRDMENYPFSGTNINITLNNQQKSYTGVIKNLKSNIIYSAKIDLQYKNSLHYTSNIIDFTTKEYIGKWLNTFVNGKPENQLIFKTSNKIFIGFGINTYNNEYTNEYFQLTKLTDSELYTISEKHIAPFFPRNNIKTS